MKGEEEGKENGGTEELRMRGERQACQKGIRQINKRPPVTTFNPLTAALYKLPV